MDFLKKASQSLGSQGGESDLLKQAEGFVSSQTSGQKAPASTEKPAAQGASATPASGKTDYKEVYGSAQTLYQGLEDKLGGKKSNIDDQQLASAASDVLKAADNSGFAKDSQYGDYFNKAESYLQDYSAKSAAPGSGAPPATAAPPAAAPHAPAARPAAE